MFSLESAWTIKTATKTVNSTPNTKESFILEYVLR